MTDCNSEQEKDLMMRHLERQRQRQRGRRWRVVLGAAGVLLLLVLHARAPAHHRAAQLQEAPTVAEGGMTDGVDAGYAIGVPMPANPLPNWRRPPCSSKLQKAINGACWLELAAKPDDNHCGELFEYEGRCYAPVAKPQRAPLTIQEQ